MKIQYTPHRECSVLPLEGPMGAHCVGENPLFTVRIARNAQPTHRMEKTHSF
jgi:hypothetical protein